jgi:hypothetical protein
MMIIAAVAVLALIAGLFVLLSDGDDGDEAASSDEQGEIFLEPAASLGPSPFSEEVLESEPVPTTSAAISTTTIAPTTTIAGAVTAVAAVEGGAPGLYGGTRNNARCDREGMIRFLEANPAKAAAWVQALNSDPTLRWSGGTQVRADQIGDYIRELTPMTLTRDTRVTNYGYLNGRPTPRQSVLQAGSAVLVDRYGVPRARCGCGNPLIPPARVRVRPTYVGAPWPGWNPVNVVVVTQVTVIIDIFILVELGTGDRLERPAGTTGGDDTTPGTTPATTTPPSTPPPTTVAPPPVPLPTQPPPIPPPATQPPPQPPPDLGTGDVQVTLQWSGDADLDLHVTDPTGFEIYFGAKNSPSGGSLDADDIPDCGDNGPHVENVFWPVGGAPTGQYVAYTSNLGACESGPVAFDMTVLVNGAPAGGDGGTLSDGGESNRVSFGF